MGQRIVDVRHLADKLARLRFVLAPYQMLTRLWTITLPVAFWRGTGGASTVFIKKN